MRIRTLDDYFPPCGPCGICGGPDKRHRLWDAIRDRFRAGETAREIADDLGQPLRGVILLVKGIERKRRGRMSRWTATTTR